MNWAPLNVSWGRFRAGNRSIFTRNIKSSNMYGHFLMLYCCRNVQISTSWQVNQQLLSAQSVGLNAGRPLISFFFLTAPSLPKTNGNQILKKSSKDLDSFVWETTVRVRRDDGLIIFDAAYTHLSEGNILETVQEGSLSLSLSLLSIFFLHV